MSSEKMFINRHNYESCFLDYFEGNLNSNQVDELFKFLKLHPDLQEEFNAFEMIGLEDFSDSDAAFPDKDILFKSDQLSESTIQDWLIAETEGQLNADQLHLLDNFLKEHPARMEERKLFASTRLKEEASLPYPFKDRLKKSAMLSEATLQEWLIAELEGELNIPERNQLLHFLETHPEYNRDRALYRQTLLRVNKTETFPNKTALYRGNIKPIFSSVRILRIAAVIALFIVAAILFRLVVKENIPDRQFAVQEDTTTGNKTIEQKVSGKNSNSEGMIAAKKEEKVSPKEDTLLKNQDLKIEAPVFADKNKRQKKVSPPSGNQNAARNNYAQRTSPPRKSSIQNDTPGDPVLAENIEILPSKSISLIALEPPFAFAERRYTPKATIVYENPALPPSLAAFINPSRIEEEVLQPSAQIVNKAVGVELIGTEKTPARLPLGSRLLKMLAVNVTKISGEKIKVRTAFNPVTGKLSAYEIETRKKVIQKQF